MANNEQDNLEAVPSTSAAFDLNDAVIIETEDGNLVDVSIPAAKLSQNYINQTGEIQRSILVTMDRSINAQSLMDFLAGAGQVQYLRIFSGETTTSASVEFTRESSASKALAMNGQEIDGNPITIRRCTQAIIIMPTEETEPASEKLACNKRTTMFKKDVSADCTCRKKSGRRTRSHSRQRKSHGRGRSTDRELTHDDSKSNTESDTAGEQLIDELLSRYRRHGRKREHKRANRSHSRRRSRGRRSRSHSRSVSRHRTQSQPAACPEEAAAMNQQPQQSGGGYCDLWSNMWKHKHAFHRHGRRANWLAAAAGKRMFHKQKHGPHISMHPEGRKRWVNYTRHEKPDEECHGEDINLEQDGVPVPSNECHRHHGRHSKRFGKWCHAQNTPGDNETIIYCGRKAYRVSAI